MTLEVSPSLFRAYDIRGVVGKTLTAPVVHRIGLAIGAEAALKGEQAIVVGRDGRRSSPELAAALIAGLRESGRDVTDIGMVPTPVLYFATRFLKINSGVMVTGSHNGPEYNGLKIIIAGQTLFEDALQAIYQRAVQGAFNTGAGGLRLADVSADYLSQVTADIPAASGEHALKLVIDCGNGVAGLIAPSLFRALGHEVVEMCCEVDGDFPHHHPDPSQPENLQALIGQVRERKADLGFAFDGDGDRLGVIDGGGNIIWPDRQLMLMARDVLSRHRGAKIIYDVKCSRHLKTVIEAHGGEPVMWKTGHSLIKNKMEEHAAPLAGELSGHIFFRERWYGFDDAIYAGARLLEIIMQTQARPERVFAELPGGVSTPELRVGLPEERHQPFMRQLKDQAVFPGAEVIDTDGIRIEFQDGWGLIRPSNTSPCLTLRFEADDQAALERIQGEFRALLQATAAATGQSLSL